MCIVIIILIALAFLPYVNAVVAIFFSIIAGNYKLILGTIALFVLYIFVTRLDKKENDQYLESFYSVNDARNLEFFSSYDVFTTYHPKYSLVDTDLEDGYHEKAVKKNGKEEIHKMTAKYGEYISYVITNAKGDTLRDQKQFLQQQQLKNYEKDHPNKKVVLGDEPENKGFLGYLKDVIYVLCIIAAFYSYYINGNHTYVESFQNLPKKKRPKLSKNEIILEPEDVLDKGIDEATLEVLQSDVVNDSELLDVNLIKEEEFATLKGISLVQAKYLIQEREENGDYTSLEDFYVRNDISDRVKENIHDHLYCEEKEKKRSKRKSKDNKSRNKGRRLEL